MDFILTKCIYRKEKQLMIVESDMCEHVCMCICLCTLISRRQMKMALLFKPSRKNLGSQILVCKSRKLCGHP